MSNTDRLIARFQRAIVWTKGDADCLEIWVDRGDGKGFIFLAIDSQPDYPDTTASLPATGASAVWKYKGIYRLADEQAGQWSDIISTTVAG